MKYSKSGELMFSATVFKTYDWFDCDFSIFGKSSRAVMHNAFVIIGNAEITHNSAVIFIEIVFASTLYILPMNAYEIVSIGSALLMIKSNGMHEFMNDNTATQAFCWAKIHNLSTSFHAHTWPTSTIIWFNINPIPIAFQIWPKSNAGIVVVFLHCR